MAARQQPFSLLMTFSRVGETRGAEIVEVERAADSVRRSAGREVPAV